MINIGVLALQGSVIEHLNKLNMLEGVTSREVRLPRDLDGLSGLILPGGESTTIGKLIRDFRLLDPIVQKAKEGLPIWGTCAGMILMAKEIVNENYVHLGIMDVAVRRNAYGCQLDSFCSSVSIPEVCEKDVKLVFIRAPWVERVFGNAEIFASIDGRIIAAKQGNIFATSFHPELTDDLSFHRYFLKMIYSLEKSDV